MNAYIPGVFQDAEGYVFVSNPSEISESETPVMRLSLPLLAQVVSFLPRADVDKLKGRTWTRDLVSCAQIFNRFPQIYLEQISPLYSSLDPISSDHSHNFKLANQKAASLAYLDDKRLSPVRASPEENLSPALYRAYAGASELLFKRDVVLCNFFEKFLEVHKYPKPDFMTKNLEIAEKAKQIRQHLKQNRYELTTLFRRSREIPPEAVSLLQMSDEKFETLYFYCRGFKFLPDTWLFEVMFAFIESGRLTDDLWEHMSSMVFEEAIRTHRNECAKIFLQKVDIEKIFLIALMRWKVLAQKWSNEEIVSLLEEKLDEELSKRGSFCFSLFISCGCFKDNIYGDVEAGIFTKARELQFRQLEPLEWYPIQSRVTLRHPRLEAAYVEWDVLKRAFAEENEYLERLAGPTQLFSSEKPISLEDFNRYLTFTHERAKALVEVEEIPALEISWVEVPSIAVCFPDLYRDYFRAIKSLKKRDEALIQFFEDYLRLHRLPTPSYMQEINLAKKARLIREGIKNQTLSTLSANYRYYATFRFWERDYHTTKYPPEIAHFRMTHGTFGDALKHCYHHNHDETLFALIESGHLEYFSSLHFPGGPLVNGRFWIDSYKKVLKEILLKAKEHKRVESIEILLRVLAKGIIRRKCLELFHV